MLVAAAGAAVAVARDDPGPLTTRPTFSVLERPAGTRPDLRGRAGYAVPDDARYVGWFRGHHAFLARGGEDVLCAYVTEADTVGSSCATVGPPGQYSPTILGSGLDDGRWLLLVPVPDQFTRVEVDGRTLHPSRNAVLVDVPPADGTLTLSGDGVRQRVALRFGAR